MNTTLFLRFPDDATFRSLLPTDFVQQGETGAPLPDGVSAISIIGALTKEDGTYDADGNVITPPTPIAGWHVNAEGSLPDAWAQYEVNPPPMNPRRIFG